MELSQIVASQPFTPVELISSLIGILGLVLLAYGIHVMGRGNTERQAIAGTLNTHTQPSGKSSKRWTNKNVSRTHDSRSALLCRKVKEEKVEMMRISATLTRHSFKRQQL